MSLTLTTRGKALLVRAVTAGTPVVFSRIALGSGDDCGADAQSLSHEMLSLEINDMTTGNGVVTLTVVYNNADIPESFRLTEAGVFVQDPDVSGGEILYCYQYTPPEAADIVPAAEERRLETEMRVLVYVGGAAHITAEIPSGAYATRTALLELEDRLDEKTPFVLRSAGNAAEAYVANKAGRPVFWMVPSPGLLQPALYPLVETSCTNVFGRMSYRLVFALPVLERGVQKIKYRQVACTVENGVVTNQGETSETITLQEKLTFDPAPAGGSENPVTSGGVFSALAALEARVAALESA